MCINWINMVPLNRDEALDAFKRGLKVLCLRSDLSYMATSKAAIMRHARRGGVFAVDRDALVRQHTHFIAHYTIMCNESDCNAVKVSRQYATRDEACDNCKNLLTQTLRAHGIQEDGEYWATYELDKYFMGNYEHCYECDEGYITLKGNEVTDVPAGFWMPF